MFDFFYIIGAFIEKGGQILILIFLVAFAMWSVILDKLYFHLFTYKKDFRIDTKASINKRYYLFKKGEFDAGMSFIRICIISAPLLGLLGTVLGMIEVFDIIAILGNSDAKAMAGGISQATIPTMVGMSVALSGMIFRTYLEQNRKKMLRLLSEKLHLQVKKGRR